MGTKLLLLALSALLLVGCQAKPKGAVSSEGPAEAGSSFQPEPPPQPKTVQELLEEQPVDDTHDAFLVDTGGRMGALLVTTELVPCEEPKELLYYLHLSVWDPSAPEGPIPIQEIDWETVHYGEHEIVDVNFDGFQDFTYLFHRGIQVEGYHCMVWDEEQGRFQELSVYAEIPSPYVDPETKTITGWSRSSAAGDGRTPIYQWVDGELVCVRNIEVFKKDWRDPDTPMVVKVEDRMDGELTEVFRGEFPIGSMEYFDERSKWGDLDYHGETE